MKTLTILVAMILLTCCVTSQVSARFLESTPSLRNEELQWWYHKPRFPSPVVGKALPPLPPGYFHSVPFNPPPEVAKCLSDCKEVKTCFADIRKAYFTRQPAIGSDCCAAIEKTKDDCEKTVFGSFHNQFFNGLVKRHCSNKVGSSPTPSPA